MIIKKYQGKTEADAKEKAEKEMGTGIFVMNVKTIKQKGIMKLFKAPVVEITVAMEEETEPPFVKQLQKPETGKSAPIKGFDAKVDEKSLLSGNREEDRILEEKLDSIHNLLKEQMKEQGKEKDKDKDKDKEPEDFKADIPARTNDTEQIEEKPNQRDNVLNLIRDTLIENEVAETYVSSIMEEAKSSLKEDTPMDYILSHVYQRMILRFGKAEPIGATKEGPKVIFFVGTTGVGKTTTIAKIASKFVVNAQKEERNKVALLTADTYRIAAAEQLRTYANILEVPFRVIYTQEEMGTAIRDFWEYEYIFVDTAGHSQNNDEQRDTMVEYVDYVKQFAQTEVFLVLSATTKYKDLLAIADKYSKLVDYKLIFTKLDETSTYGNLFNLKMYTQATMSYVTYGQNVPDDFDLFNAQSTVKKLLGGK